MLVEICLEKRIIDLGNDWDVENEYVEVELDTQDIVNVFAKYYKVDKITALKIVNDFELYDSEILKDIFEEELEIYAREKYYKEMQDYD